MFWPGKFPSPINVACKSTQPFSIFQILVNVALRLLMVENLVQTKRDKFNNTKTRRETTQKSSNRTTPDSLPPSEHPSFNPNVIDEHTSLLSSGSKPQTEVKKGLQFYTYIFRHRSFAAALYSYMVFSIIISAFEATLPLHVQEIFNWGAFPSGMLFVLIGAPGILLNPLCGWLRDHLGTRHPTWIAFVLLAPFMWLLGCPGDARYPWANGANGQGIYIASVVGIGTVSCMLSSVAAIETRCKSLPSPPSHQNPCFLSPIDYPVLLGFSCHFSNWTKKKTVVVDTLEERHPGIFGPTGGYSRAYSVCSMSWTLGMLLGPLLSGCLSCPSPFSSS